MRHTDKTELNHKIIDAMLERYPKFNKIALSMINNSGYGVDFSAPAKKYLKECIPEFKMRQNSLNRQKKEPTTRTISIRVENTVYDDIKAKADELGVSVNEYLKGMIK